MAVMKTNISWTDSTWNPTTGCTKVSAGCEHCYAEQIVRRWGGDFAQVKTHPDRLAAVRRFTPLIDHRGQLVPRRVFVNSMSDLMHEQISDAFRDQCFDAMEQDDVAVFQVLTKRPMTMRRYIERRYGGRPMPRHIWLGASVEDNRVRGRIDTMRALKEQHDAVTFLSVEPLLGLPDRHDYRGIDQVLIGGESGPRARPMDPEWARCAVQLARAAGAAVWFKQFGQWANNPLYARANGPTHLERVRQAIRAGEKEARIDMSSGRPMIVGEKGGSTLDGAVLHEMPAAFAEITKRLQA